MYKRIKAPFAWIGGKSKLAKSIIEIMPKHKIYIEVFGGALNIFYAKSKIPLEVVNDINGDLINLHKCIKNNPETLSIYLNNLLISRELFSEIKLKRYKPRNNIERAALYYFLITQSFGATMSSFAMNTKSFRKPKNIYKDFYQYSKRLKLTTIENMSFEKLIKTYDNEEALFYCDPPYYKTEKYYKNITFREKEHKLLKNYLQNIKGKFIVSYNNCSFIRELYKDFNIIKTKKIEYTLGKNMHKRKKELNEILIFNYDLNDF